MTFPRRRLIPLFALLALAFALPVLVADAAEYDGARSICADARSGESCGPGNGRKTPGGGEKVSHKGWPAVTGVLWKVNASHDSRLTGGSLNDELLGHHGEVIRHFCAHGPNGRGGCLKPGERRR